MEVAGVSQGVSVLVLVMLGTTTVEVSTEGTAVVADWTSAVEVATVDGATTDPLPREAPWVAVPWFSVAVTGQIVV